jgi:hypothetical protein
MEDNGVRDNIEMTRKTTFMNKFSNVHVVITPPAPMLNAD